jgi:hypothetical protein
MLDGRPNKSNLDCATLTELGLPPAVRGPLQKDGIWVARTLKGCTDPKLHKIFEALTEEECDRAIQMIDKALRQAKIERTRE